MPRTRLSIRAATNSRVNTPTTHFGFPQGGGGFNDPTAPVLSSISSGSPGATSATITWTTDKLADTQVFWGLTTAYAGATSPLMNFTLTTSHSQLISGLVTATVYHYKVLSRTPDGGYAFSTDGTFTTA